MNKCWERSSNPFEFRFDSAFYLCGEFPLMISGCWNNKFEFLSLVERSYDCVFCLDLRLIEPSQGLSFWQLECSLLSG